MFSLEGLEHAVWIRAREIGSEPWSRILWVTNRLQRIPMLEGSPVGVHFVDIDTSDPGIFRIVVEQVQEIHMSKDIVANRNDLIDDDASIGPLLGDLAEELSQRFRAIGNQRIVLDIARSHKCGDGFLRLFLVNHKIVEAKDIVLVADGAAIVGVYKLDHGSLLVVECEFWSFN